MAATRLNAALAAYPVGSIYMSVSGTSPATLFGGTWERISGRFLLAATDGGSSGASQAAGRTGGEATHALTPNETATKNHSHTMNHGHFIAIVTNTAAGNARWGLTTTDAAGVTRQGMVNYDYAGSTGGQTAANGAAHNNMPPYLAVYVWKRTA